MDRDAPDASGTPGPEPDGSLAHENRSGGGQTTIEREIEEIAFRLGRNAIAPTYPLPSVITEWASSTKCAATR